MVRHENPMTRGMGRDTPPLGDALQPGKDRYGNVHGAPDEVAAAPPVHFALASRDPYVGGPPALRAYHAAGRTQCTGSSNQAMWAVGHTARKRDGISDGIAHIRVAGDDEVMANGPTDAPHAFDILSGGPATDFELYASVTGFLVTRSP